MGYYVWGVPAFGMGHLGVKKGPTFSAAYFGWALTNKRPDLPNVSLRLPYSEIGLYRFEALDNFPACTAVTLGGANDGCLLVQGRSPCGFM